MKLIRRQGSTSHIFQIFIADSSSTTGAGLTGLTSASAGLTAYYHRNTDTTATAISLVTMTLGTFTSGGFKEIDSTNMPGWYQFCPPDAAFTSGANSVGFHLKGATNMAPLPIEVDLDAQVDVYFWNGTAVATPATAGVPDVNVKNINNVAATSVTTVNANIGTTQPTNFTGTGGSALVKSDMVDIAGAAVSTASAQIGVNVVNVKGSASAGAAGYVGIDWSAINAPTTTVNLSGTTIATVTNQLTAAAIATGVWQDATAGDFTVASSIGKALYINNVAPGGSGGHLISGSNAGTTTFGALTVTGATTLTGAVTATNASNNITGVTVAGYASGQAPLQPTVAGRTLDVTATGAAGIDWGNLENPTTTVNLSSTTIGTVTTVTNAVTANVIRTGTAQAGGANTITLDAGASATNNTYQNEIVYISSGTGAGQVNTISSYVGATKVATMISNWATNPDNTSVFIILPQGPISATVSGSVTVGGYSAGQDPATLVLDATASSHNTAGTIGAKINTAGGYTIPTTTQIATAVWQDSTASDFTTAGSIGLSLGGSLGTALFTAGKVKEVTLVDTLTTYTGNTPQTGDSFARIGATGSGLTSLAPASTALSTAQWTNSLATNLGTLAGHDPGSTLASHSDITGLNNLSASQVENAVWDGLTASHSTVGSFGLLVKTDLDATVSSRAPSSTALSTAQWTNSLATNLGTLASHDPGTTLGTSTLTQVQVTGGAYALNSASFAFNAALDFTATQKAATLARVTLTDTVTTYTGNTPQTGDSFARIGATGSGLTSLASAAAVAALPTAAQNAAATLAATVTELVAVPAASPSLSDAVSLLFMTLRNEITVDATTKTVHNDAGTALGAKTLTDNGTTYTEGKLS